MTMTILGVRDYEHDGSCENARCGRAGRYYDPTTAQFLTPDPLYAITGPRYGYAGNDPINRSDPTGLFGWSSITHAVSHVAHDVNNDIVKPVERTNIKTD